MVREKGIIEKVAQQMAVVRIRKTSACATCESRGACQMHGAKEMLVEVRNDIRAKVGDCVELSIPTRSFLGISLLVYLLPVLALILGAYVGGAWAESSTVSPTLASIVGGAAALGISFYALRVLDASIRRKKEYLPRMTRIVINADPGASFDGSR
ncbi:MAG: SoxR reducing system RseC family protein [Proteobacteria bacterium]|nr:SoxR reducing system RseC family protein [Pseudomonadota bacterium]